MFDVCVYIQYDIAIPTGGTNYVTPINDNITDGKQLNIYMANGFGAVVDLFKK